MARKTSQTSTASSAEEPAGARGIALVERVLAAVDRDPSRGKWTLPAKRRPLPEAEIDAMRLAGGRRLPPSVQRLLATFGPHRQIPGEWVREKRRGKAGASSLRDVDIATLIEETYEPEVRAYFDFSPIVKGLPGRCHWLGEDEPRRFLYVGEPDAWGEYPILALQDYDDVIDVVVEYPGMDVFAACRTGVIANPAYVGGIIEDPVYGPMLRATVRQNFAPAPKLKQKQFRFAARLRGDEG